MRHSGLSWLIVLATCFVPVFGETELVLIDGRVLKGTDVRRDEGVYVLTLESGEEVVLPEGLVEAVRLTGEGRTPRRTDEGLTVGTEPGTVAGTPIPEGPTGIRVAEPETLAGQPVRPPTPSEQLEVFGPPAQFQEGGRLSEPWRPESDWDMDPENNNFNPSTWVQAPTDPTWQPESAWDPDEDVLAPSRSTWQKSVIDPTWTPTDGFKKKEEDWRR